MRKLVSSFAFLFALFSLSACGFEVVDTGYRGVETRFGKVQGEPLDEGLHFYNPFTSNVVEVSVMESNFQGDTPVFTKDNQEATISFSLVWALDPKEVGNLLSSVGREWQVEKVRVVPNFLGALKDAIGKQDAETIVQNREKAASSALAEVKRILEPMGINVLSLNLANIDFNKQYQAAVEAKMIAKQTAEKAKNDTVRVEEEAKQKIKTAEADARAMKIKSAALSQNRGLVEFEMVQKWDGALPQYMFGNTVPFIDLKQLKKD